MEEADKFAADILGVEPENLTEDVSDELLTNNEEEVSESEDNTQEETQPSEESSDAQQENTDKNLEEDNQKQSPELAQPKKANRIQKRIQQLLARQQDLAKERDNYGDSLTREELQDLVRKEAQALMEEQEIIRLQEEQQELWVDDLEYLIQNNPELNPDSPEYNKQLDDFLTNLVVDENGNPNTNVPIADIYSQLTAILGKQKQIKSQQNKKVLAEQLDEAPLGDGSQAQYQRSKKTIADLDPNDPVAFLKAIESGEVDY